jgi:mannose-6-phosphate isomerase-like protein (cupin superfamily)
MHVTRFNAAKTYNPPKHPGAVAYRLQGMDTSPVQDFWVGVSHFLPGGGAELDATPTEKVYVVLSGKVTVEAGGQRVTLEAYDSCMIGKNEERRVVNESSLPASMLVVISTPKAAA